MRSERPGPAWSGGVVMGSDGDVLGDAAEAAIV